jgi:hypothetical protein
MERERDGVSDRWQIRGEGSRRVDRLRQKLLTALQEVHKPAMQKRKINGLALLSLDTHLFEVAVVERGARVLHRAHHQRGHLRVRGRRGRISAVRGGEEQGMGTTPHGFGWVGTHASEGTSPRNRG